MNLQLLNPNHYINAYPEYIEDQLAIDQTTYSTFLKFNARGTLLAFGCLDGRVIIFDFTTRSLSRTLMNGPSNMLINLKQSGKKFNYKNDAIDKPRVLTVEQAQQKPISRSASFSQINDHGNNNAGMTKAPSKQNLLNSSSNDNMQEMYDENGDNFSIPPMLNSQPHEPSGHTLGITCVSWFRNSKKLVSASYDYKVLLWDVLNKKIDKAYQFCSSVWKVEMNPKNKYVNKNIFLKMINR